ncbi:MAG: hypothetical protein JNK87_11820 [Bryobacterales bacterium]|nr:hypothetical protein [Bryobacterales bacterium]
MIEPVEINGITVVPEGASATGTITVAQESGRMGRGGKLDFSVDRVRAADGRWVPVRYHLQKKHGDSKAISTGILTAGAVILFWPAAPLFLLRKGKDTDIHRGVAFDVYTDRNHVLGSSQPLAAPPPFSPSMETATPVHTLVETKFSPAPGNGPSPYATITINGAEQGGEIEVDGRFAGSMPSVLKVAPGDHVIRVRLGKQIWERTIGVQLESHVNLVPVFASSH